MSNFHTSGPPPCADFHLDLHTNGLAHDLDQATLIASSPTNSVRVDLRRRQARELLEWLAEELNYGLVLRDQYTSRDHNLLRHYAKVSHNTARCPACEAGH